MALVVETGSGADPAANSYADVDAIKAYIDARGGTYPTAPEIEQRAILAMDYIEALEPQMLGYRTHGLEQPLSFPRTGLYFEGSEYPSDQIPTLLINAQSELCWQQFQGVNIFPVTTGQAVKRRKVGPIEREFFGPAETPVFPMVDNWLSWLLQGGGASWANPNVIRA